MPGQKGCQRSLVEITILSSAFSPKVFPLCQSTMSLTNVATSMNKMKKFWVLSWGGSKLLWWKNALACSIRVACKLEATFDKLDDTRMIDDVEALWGDKKTSQGVDI